MPNPFKHSLVTSRGLVCLPECDRGDDSQESPQPMTVRQTLARPAIAKSVATNPFVRS